MHDFEDGTRLSHPPTTPRSESHDDSGFRYESVTGCWYCVRDEERRYKEHKDFLGLRRYMLDERQELKWAWEAVLKTVPP